MQIKNFSEIGVKDWNAFCQRCDSAWFFHTSHWLNLCRVLDPDFKNINLSFAVTEGASIIGLVPLVAQRTHDDANLFEFAMGSVGTPFPALIDGSVGRERVLSLIFSTIANRAMQNKVVYAKFYIEPLADKLLTSIAYNELLKHDFFETSLTTNIIDLGKSLESLYSNISKGNRSAIKSAVGNQFKVNISDKKNIKAAEFSKYKRIYELASGIKSDQKRWDVYQRLVTTGFGTLFLLKIKSTAVAGSFIFKYKNKAYYATSAIDPKYRERTGIGQLLQWEIIKYLKNTGYKHYEIGLNIYDSISESVYSKREISIGAFKSRFGAKVYPYFRGEYFYNMDYLLKRKSALIETFIKNHS